MPGGTPPSRPPAAGGMSLYANLLDPKAAAGDSTPTARDNNGHDAGAAASGTKKPLDPATLRFQPVRRPQPGQKPKPKISFVKAAPATFAAAAAPAPAAPAAALSATPTPPIVQPTAAPAAPAQPSSRSKLADWAATEEDEYLYGTGGSKRQRGGRKAKKKNNNGRDDRHQTDWDELYDLARPTNVDEYLRSDERIAEIRDWKVVLYAHRRRREREGSGRRRSSSRGSNSSDGSEIAGGRARINQFAPPPSFSFAPPPPSPPRASTDQQAAPSVPDDAATGDAAYARRQALSQSTTDVTQPPGPIYGGSTKPSAGATISRAPVRYDRPPSPSADFPVQEMDIDEDDETGRPGLGLNDQQHQPQSSLRPGQAGFAARMMEKMGWEKGKGLGADGTGIVSGLGVKVDKRRRRPDAEGGGFADPARIGRIVGGRRAPGDEGSSGKFGHMSDVVVLRGMLEGMEDVAGEVAGGLAQEIGEECGEKYGRVERLYIDAESRQVFIKFTDQVSALRAVNALDGRVFNGNAIVPSFYDSEKFEQGIY